MQDKEVSSTAGRDAVNINIEGSNNIINFGLNEDILGIVNSALLDEFSDKKYTVLLCGPKSDDAKSKSIMDLLISELNKNEIDIVIGGNENGLEGMHNEAYPHVEEANYVEKSMCNSIIIIVSDYTTISQLSLLSYVKLMSKNDSIDIVVIPNYKVLEDHPFILSGPIKLVDDYGKIFKLPDLGDFNVMTVVDRICNRRLMYYQQRRGRTKKV